MNNSTSKNWLEKASPIELLLCINILVFIFFLINPSMWQGNLSFDPGFIRIATVQIPLIQGWTWFPFVAWGAPFFYFILFMIYNKTSRTTKLLGLLGYVLMVAAFLFISGSPWIESSLQ